MKSLFLLNKLVYRLIIYLDLFWFPFVSIWLISISFILLVVASSSSRRSVVTPSPTTISTSTSTSFFKSILLPIVLGIPSITNSTINFISFLINTILYLLILHQHLTPVLFESQLDLTYIRVGSVTHEGVRLSARLPPPAYLLGTEFDFSGGDEDGEDEEAGARIVYRVLRSSSSSSSSSKWTAVQMRGNLETDWTTTLALTGLYSATEYEYRVLSPVAPHSHHSAFPSTLRFLTAPDPALFIPGSKSPGGTFSFASSSSLIPGFPYDGPSTESRYRILGARYLNEFIERNSNLRFMLFLGDFNAANSAALYDGVDKIQRQYRQVFASLDWKRLIERLPILSIYDHRDVQKDVIPSNAAAFQHYLGAGNPLPRPLVNDPDAGAVIDPTSSKEEESVVNYFEYRYGDAAFFILDTTAFQSLDDAEEDRTILGQTQFAVLEEWIQRVNQTVTWKFVVSSIPMMTLWRGGWSECMEERERVLDLLEYVPNVVVISAGRHEFAAAMLRNSTTTEISTSPLNHYYLPIRTLSQSYAKLDDTLIKYIPDGNSKFSVFEVDSRNATRPVVHVKVIIDGEEAWKIDILGKALKPPNVGSTIGSLGLSFRELLRFLTRSWF